MRSAFLNGPRPSYIFAAMLVVATAVAFPMYCAGAPLALAAFFGAVCGVLGTWLFAYIGHRFLKLVTPPFRAGDPVVVMRGPPTGATGTVKQPSSAGQVVVELQGKPDIVTLKAYEVEKL